MRHVRREFPFDGLVDELMQVTPTGQRILQTQPAVEVLPEQANDELLSLVVDERVH
jgi:hypothetical protein